jgi:Serine/Threonine/Tyrosine Kinase found in polyvalent proteins
MALHNVLFPGARLQLEGLVQVAGRPWPVMSQAAVRAKRGARRDEVEPFMHRLGFARTRGEDYRHPEGILVEDLHDENVFIDQDDNLVVIDPVIYLTESRPSSRPSSPESRHPSREQLTRTKR